MNYLNKLDSPAGMIDQPSLVDLLVNDLLQLRMAGLVQGDGWEQVVDQGHEERLVFVCERREVKENFQNSVFGPRTFVVVEN